MLDDSQIIQLLIQNPSEGLYEGIKKYRSMVSAIIGRVLRGHPQDIEECIEDTFLSLWKTVEISHNEITNLKAYLACSARNTAINRYRQLQRQNIIDISDLEIAEEKDMLLEFENKSNSLRIQKLVSAMDEPDREIFIRKYFLFERVKEIARRTGLDEIQVKNRLYRGKQKLRRQLEERDSLYETV